MSPPVRRGDHRSPAFALYRRATDGRPYRVAENMCIPCVFPHTKKPPAGGFLQFNAEHKVGADFIIFTKANQMLNRQRAITQFIVGIGALVDAEHGGHLRLRQVAVFPPLLSYFV